MQNYRYDKDLGYIKPVEASKFTEQDLMNLFNAMTTKITIIGNSKAIEKIKDCDFPPSIIVKFVKCEYLDEDKIYIMDGNGLNKPININYKEGEDNNGNN